MATRKKAKTKARKKKKSPSRKSTARKKVARRPAAKAKAKKATAAKKKPAAAKAQKPAARPAAVKAAAAAPQPVAAVPAGEERIGIVTHYFNHLSVAILKLEAGVLRVGETIHIKGHTSDFYQQVESMEINHVHVNEARPGQSFGLRVKDHAREHDVVYKAKRP